MLLKRGMGTEVSFQLRHSETLGKDLAVRGRREERVFDITGEGEGWSPIP